MSNTQQNKSRILLLQVRKDDMKEHEYTCFLRYAKLAEDELVSLDTFEPGDFSVEDIAGYDAVMIGGSGEFCIGDDGVIEANKILVDAIQYCYEHDVPFLGTCYGAQLAAVAFGGSVDAREEYRETGTFEVRLTAEGKEDPFIGQLPEVFDAQLGHKDSITKLPDGAVLLASSQKCPIQAFRFPDKLFYAIQFHTELDRDDLLLRVDYYSGYAKDKDDLERLKREVRNTPDAARIPELFVHMVRERQRARV